MISISKLLHGLDSYGENLRYGRKPPPPRRKPIVVWNVTGRCNLSCVHCYADSSNRAGRGELSTVEARGMIRDLAEFKIPALLFSGGEPLLRKDILQLNDFARKHGMRTTLSTNGTLITKPRAVIVAGSGFDYVGISLDGLDKNHDRFRRKDGAFRKALSAIRNLMNAGQKVGVRFTITRRNFGDIPGLLRLVEDEGIPRICFYHLVYSGRGGLLREEDISQREARVFMDMIIDWTASLWNRRDRREVLTVDNHADAVYLYLKLRRNNPDRAERALDMLTQNGGNGSGVTIGCVDHKGLVHPDQFWRGHPLGNVRAKPFSQIWSDPSNEMLSGLRSRKALLKGRCGYCSFIDVCNGNFRARAEAVYGDPWMEDPACYLSENEIRSE